jgi:hypothetical protein
MTLEAESARQGEEILRLTTLLTNDGVNTIFTKSIRMEIAFSVGAEAMNAVDAIKARIQSGDTRGEEFTDNFAYRFILK